MVSNKMKFHRAKFLTYLSCTLREISYMLWTGFDFFGLAHTTV